MVFCAARNGLHKVLIFNPILSLSTVSFRMEVKISPTYDVSAIGLKLNGNVGSFLAGPLGMR